MTNQEAQREILEGLMANQRVGKTLVIGLIFTNNERWNGRIHNSFVFSSTKTCSMFVDSEEPFLPDTYRSKKLEWFSDDKSKSLSLMLKSSHSRAEPCFLTESVPPPSHQQHYIHSNLRKNLSCLLKRTKLSCQEQCALLTERFRVSCLLTRTKLSFLQYCQEQNLFSADR
jgi:hypothetical protein